MDDDERCAQCDMLITSGQIGPIKQFGNNVFYHKECFRCSGCKKMLLYNDAAHPLIFGHTEANERVIFHEQCKPHFQLKPSHPNLHHK